ncbi:hypothetical protein F5888DRAFT_1631730 [Russula emetica]|nr:hypothetical protein F5888DRAFT_1631730 [Russula emetica]
MWDTSKTSHLHLLVRPPRGTHHYHSPTSRPESALPLRHPGSTQSPSQGKPYCPFSLTHLIVWGMNTSGSSGGLFGLERSRESGRRRLFLRDPRHLGELDALESEGSRTRSVGFECGSLFGLFKLFFLSLAIAHFRQEHVAVIYPLTYPAQQSVTKSRKMSVLDLSRGYRGLVFRVTVPCGRQGHILEAMEHKRTALRRPPPYVRYAINAAIDVLQASNVDDGAFVLIRPLRKLPFFRKHESSLRFV